MAAPFRYVITDKINTNPHILQAVLLVDVPTTLQSLYADPSATALWSTPTPTAQEIQDIKDGKIAQRTVVIDMRSRAPDHTLDVLLDARWTDFKARVETVGLARQVGDYFNGTVWTSTGAVPQPPPTPPPPTPPSNTLDIGIYYLPPSVFATAVSRGINLAHEWAGPAGSKNGYLDAAAALNMKVWLELAWLTPGGAQNHTDLTNLIDAYKDHPALEGFMFVDEPDLRNLDVTTTINAYNHCKTRTSKPMNAVITFEKDGGNTGIPALGVPYIPACDVIFTDKYPIPYGGPSFVRGPINIALANAGGRPVGVALQAFDWNGAFGPSRPPTPTELRQMGLEAISATSGLLARIYLYDYSNLITDCADSWAQMGSITAAWRAAAV